MFQPERLGRYLLIRKLATGGMAEIFLAKLLGVAGFEKEIVIKKILPQWTSDREFIAMLIDEAKISVQLNHPHIVQVYELAREGDSYYISMEYLQGIDLRRLMQRASSLSKKIPIDVCLTIMTDLLEGLAYAHARKDRQGHPMEIVHRDISPQNVLVSFDGTAKITDFGIARAASRSHETMVGVLKGKFAYMSPEQANQGSLDARSDLFSAAVVLYELLTAERLFYHGSDLDTLDRVRRGQITFSSHAEKVIPPRLREILTKALAREKIDRLQDAFSFRDEILKFARRSKKELRREKVAHFLSILFADEIRNENEETTKILSQVTPLLNDETKSVEIKEVFVSKEPDRVDTIVPVKRDFAISRRPGAIFGGTLAVLLVLAISLILWLAGRGADKKIQIVASLPPAKPVDEKRLPVPPEVIPQVIGSQALPPALPETAPSNPPHLPPPTLDISEKKPAPPKTPTELGQGFLSVQAIPWGYVTVDGGGKRWETPVRRLPLSAGQHSVKVLYAPEGTVVTSNVRLENDRELVCVANFRGGKEIRCGN